MKHGLMPITMGALMGLMMLWMLHGALTGNGTSAMALVIFIGAHLLGVALLLGAVFFAARLAPQLQVQLNRLHRLSVRHVGLMLGSASTAIAAVHLAIHGMA
jgi:hypothetical protein